MGRGPPEAILRKLMRNYFKFNLSRRSFDTASAMLPQFQASWEKYGHNSPQAYAIMNKIDAATFKDENDYKSFQKTIKTYPILMNQMMHKTKTKYQVKGKSPIGVYFRNQNIKHDTWERV